MSSDTKNKEELTRRLILRIGLVGNVKELLTLPDYLTAVSPNSYISDIMNDNEDIIIKIIRDRFVGKRDISLNNIKVYLMEGNKQLPINILNPNKMRICDSDKELILAYFC